MADRSIRDRLLLLIQSPDKGSLGLRPAAVLVAGLVLFVGAFFVDGSRLDAGRPSSAASRRPPATAAPGPAARAEPPRSSSSGTSLPATPGSTAPVVDDRIKATEADRGAIRIATQGFLVAWLQPGTPEQRTVALGPYTSDRFLPAVAAIPSAALPSAAVAGIDRVDTDGMRALVAARLTDGQQLSVELVSNARGWQVTALDRPAGPVPQR